MLKQEAKAKCRSTKIHFALTCQNRLKHQAGKQNQTSIAVGFEYGEAIVGIGDIEPDDLPSQMRRESNKPQRENQSGAGGQTGRADENDCGGIK